MTHPDKDTLRRLRDIKLDISRRPMPPPPAWLPWSLFVATLAVVGLVACAFGCSAWEVIR